LREITLIEGVSDLKNAVLVEMNKLYEPDEVKAFEIIRSDFWTSHVYVSFSITVRGQKKVFHGRVDRETAHVNDLSLISTTS